MTGNRLRSRQRREWCGADGPQCLLAPLRHDAARHFHLAARAVNFLGLDSLMVRLMANRHLAFVAGQSELACPAVVVRAILAATPFAIARRFLSRSLGSERDLIGRDFS